MRLMCNLFGHNFQVSKNVTSHVKEYKCSYCKKELTTNGKGNLIDLTPKYREINITLSGIHAKRQSKNKEKLQPTIEH